MLVLAAAVAVVSCAQSGDRTRSGLFEPHRVSVAQGNYVTQPALDRVRRGMTPDQVRRLLGTPLVRDVFHPNRWDYVFRMQYPDGSAVLRRATVFFENERVAGVEAHDLPASEDGSDPVLPSVKAGD
ncbi:MAG: outer membrane protein assembly factor BamE [Burkholderiales bacterium]|nr:MAG: outer membrane protein assembly factor BamE [Burkholderiales bacterium]